MNKSLFNQKNFPILQQVLYENQHEAINCPTGDLNLVQDPNTGIIINNHFDESKIHYDSRYTCEQSLSKKFQDHLIDVSLILEKFFNKENVIEIGCGKGFFLNLLTSRGFEILGFDPSYEGTNPKIIKTYFDDKSNFQSEGIILRHVLEHIVNPVIFLENLKKSNKSKGLIYIEVPNLDWIIEHNAIYDIFYEHVNYFRLCDFENMFDNILSLGTCFGGQYIYIVADLSSFHSPSSSFKSIDELKLTYDKMPFMDKNISKINIWGGASKGVIFSILNHRNNIQIDNIIDINPNKQNKYIPILGTKIISPEESMSKIEPNSIIYVMNSLYLDEIKNITSNKFNLLTID